MEIKSSTKEECEQKFHKWQVEGYKCFKNIEESLSCKNDIGFASLL